MAPAIDRVLRLVGAQVAVQVGLHAAGDVLLGKHRVGLGGVGQIEAAIEHQERRAAGLKGLELIDRNQVGEHQNSSAGGLGRARVRSTVAAMPQAMMRAMPSQPRGGM